MERMKQGPVLPPPDDNETWDDLTELDPDFVDEARSARSKHLEGERWLLRRLLDLSIEDYRAGGKRRAAVEPWFFGEPVPPVRLWTFECVCEHLDIHPDRIRHNLHRALPSATRRATRGGAGDGSEQQRDAA